MGYLHIPNLYKAQEILAFKRCFAMEKIHGTSAHIKWHDGQLTFFSGGESYVRFVALFDKEGLADRFRERTHGTSEGATTVYGEAYGGKQQGMSKTYGQELKFVAFDVQVGERWLPVPAAHACVVGLGLEFVDYADIETTAACINAERDRPSLQAIRNGVVEPKIREGVVLRPPFEVTGPHGERIIAKHKREEFSERGSPKVERDPSRREMLAGAEAIAEEWVTPMRLEHVIVRLISERENKDVEMRDIPAVVALMVEDVTREAAGEIVDSQPARKAMSARTVALFKARIQSVLQEIA